MSYHIQSQLQIDKGLTQDLKVYWAGGSVIDYITTVLSSVTNTRQTSLRL